MFVLGSLNLKTLIIENYGKHKKTYVKLCSNYLAYLLAK